jgi:putative membrane protein
MRRATLVLLACLIGEPAFAHEGHVHWNFSEIWTWDLWITLPLALSGTLYPLGVTRLWRRVGVNRGVRLWQAGCFALGWALLVVALVSPLHWLGERLFTAHMVEHEILMAMAAPLLVVARPMGGMLWALPRHWRPTIGGVGQSRGIAALWGWLTDPLIATVIHGVALWIWHAPTLYEAALSHPFVHWLQHLSFFLTAILFWWALLRGRFRERGYGAAIFYLFATALHSGFLGILLSIARAPLFPDQTSRAPLWGLTPLEDQQLAGLIMWVPAGMVYAAAALALAGLWILHSGNLGRRSNHVLATH